MSFLNLPPKTVEPEKGYFAEAMGQAPPRQRLAGMKAMVVGAGQRSRSEANPPYGNGRAVAHLIGREGATVACLDISPAALDHTVSTMTDEGIEAFGHIVDVADEEAVAVAFRVCAERLGGLDILVVNVGVSGGGRLAEIMAADWDREFAINLRSHMLFCRHALERMNFGSSIVLISSTGALFPFGQPAYEVSKSAQLALTRSVAFEGEPKAIRCNCVLPGLIDTPMGRDEAARRPNRGAFVPFGRQGTAWEIAYAVLFLVSRESSYVNGQSLVVDGGHALGITREKRLSGT